jgi:hypothetical protein
MYTVTVFYDHDATQSFMKDLARQDAAADKAAGRRSIVSGYDHQTRCRDLEYRFGTPAELEAAKVRLYDAGFRFEK